jgi:hypothetical protein
MRQRKNVWEPRSDLVLWFKEDSSFRGIVCKRGNMNHWRYPSPACPNGAGCSIESSDLASSSHNLKWAVETEEFWGLRDRGNRVLKHGGPYI